MNARFLPGGRFAYHHARGRLASDCRIRELSKRGIFPAAAHFLDFGYGQGYAQAHPRRLVAGLPDHLCNWLDHIVTFSRSHRTKYRRRPI